MISLRTDTSLIDVTACYAAEETADLLDWYPDALLLPDGVALDKRLPLESRGWVLTQALAALDRASLLAWASDAKAAAAPIAAAAIADAADAMAAAVGAAAKDVVAKELVEVSDFASHADRIAVQLATAVDDRAAAGHALVTAARAADAADAFKFERAETWDLAYQARLLDVAARLRAQK